MDPDRVYRVFLSYNISRDSDLLLGIVEAVAAGLGFEVEIFEPGGSARNPPSEVRRLFLNRSIEGLLVIIDGEESSWISNEIGMAYGFGLPIYVIAEPTVKVGGIADLISSIKRSSIRERNVLRRALENAFTALREGIEQNRRRLPEPPPTKSKLEIIRWSRYYELILDAYKTIDVGDVSQRHNRFSPTLILGISRGGIIVADILSRLCRDLRYGLLEADRKSEPPNIYYNAEITKTILKSHLLEVRKEHKQARILIVDDVWKSGSSMVQAIEQIKNSLSQLRVKNCPEVQLKSLVLIFQEGSHTYTPDYKIMTVPENVAIVLPYGLG